MLKRSTMSTEEVQFDQVVDTASLPELCGRNGALMGADVRQHPQ